MDLVPLLSQIAVQYQLPPDGAHGLSHWGRVLENGLKLAEIEGGDITVITLFAIFHDACRHNQSLDPGHGDRGANLAEYLLGDNPQVTADQLDLLKTACRQHTDGEIVGDLTLRICWDSDRLDLARVGIFPNVRYLCTNAAKDSLIIDWANTRAQANYTPNFVVEDWNKLFANTKHT
ncbi:MAG: hypothetical protein KAU23_04975 [Anaerolineales bacterium]|nr:hypothetical protein [Anaerolineales bacterium]